MLLLKCNDLQMCTSPEFLQRWCGDDSSCDLEDCGKSLDPWSFDGTASPDPELSFSGFKCEKKNNQTFNLINKPLLGRFFYYLEPNLFLND